MQSFEDKLRLAKTRSEAIVIISEYLAGTTSNLEYYILDDYSNMFALREMLARSTELIIKNRVRKPIGTGITIMVNIWYDRPYEIHKIIKKTFGDNNIDNRYLFATLNCKNEDNHEAINEFIELLIKLGEMLKVCNFMSIVSYLQPDFMNMPFDADTIGDQLKKMIFDKNIPKTSNYELICAVSLTPGICVYYDDNYNTAINIISKTKNDHILKFVKLFCESNIIDEINEVKDNSKLTERISVLESENATLKKEINEYDPVKIIKDKLKNESLSITDVIKTLLD